MWWELGAAGHILLTAGKQRVVSQELSPFYAVQNPNPGNGKNSLLE